MKGLYGVMGDLDNDGLSNLFEYQHNLSISDADTDHDGIDDGEELKYWNETRNLSLSTAIEYCKNPDVDGDNITDGKEINGYEVKIIVDWKSDGTPISRMRYISPDELDPLTPYTNRTGVYLDTDQDGIPDVVESWFSNTSIVTSNKYRQQFIHKFGWALYNKYAWTINYFWTVYYKDLDEHHNRTSAWQNATQWLQNQFNPLIKDHTPPVIVKFDLWWDVQTTWLPPWIEVYAHVHLVIRDVGGIKYLRVIDEDSGESVSPDSYGETRYEIDHEFSASLWQAGFGSVHIRVVAKDYAGNYISVKKELKGAFQQVLDALAKMWDAIWNTLCKVAEAVMNAVNIFLQWLIDMVSSAINTLLGPLINAYKSWQDSLVATIKEGWNEYNATGNISADTLARFNQLLGGTFFWILMGISVGLMTLSLTLNALTFGAMTIISTVIAPVVTLAILAVFSITEEKRISLDLSGVSLSVDSIWNFVVNLITRGRGGTLYVRGENAQKTALELDAIIFKSSAVIKEWLEISIKDIIGFTAKGIAFICGVISVILAITGMATHLLPISILAIAIGGVGLGISIYNYIMHRPGETAEKLVKIATMVLSGIGITLAIISIALPEE